MEPGVGEALFPQRSARYLYKPLIKKKKGRAPGRASNSGPVSFIQTCPTWTDLVLTVHWEVSLRGAATGKVRKMSGRLWAMGVDIMKGLGAGSQQQ